MFRFTIEWLLHKNNVHRLVKMILYFQNNTKMDAIIMGNLRVPWIPQMINNWMHMKYCILATGRQSKMNRIVSAKVDHINKE